MKAFRSPVSPPWKLSLGAAKLSIFMSLRLFCALSVLAFAGCTRLKYTPEADFNRDGKVSKAEYHQFQKQSGLKTGGVAGGSQIWTVGRQNRGFGSRSKVQIEPNHSIPNPNAGGNVPDPKEIGSSPSSSARIQL